MLLSPRPNSLDSLAHFDNYSDMIIDFQKQPLFIAILIAALLFPPVLAGSFSAVHDHSQHTHEHSDGEDHHYHSQGAEVANNVSDSSSVEDCHHVSSDGGCSVHCATGSCTSVSFYFWPTLSSLKAQQNELPGLFLPDPLIELLQRPPLTTA